MLSAGCATVDRSRSASENHADIIAGYPQSSNGLIPLKLTTTVTRSAKPNSVSNDVFIIVHPAYSVFFGDLNKRKYSDAKYSLLKRQFDNEAKAIENQSATGKIVVLVVPGNYAVDSISPRSYESYLNTISAGSLSVFYVLSETSSSGRLPINEMVNLYLFLQSVKVNKVMIGGGYIGRCQREFYNQLTNYLDSSFTYIVPEISTISPEDVSEGEAIRILRSLQQQDYSPVKLFIDKKAGGKANILSLPQKRGS